MINKLVGAVDAEFTLLTNRVKMLEMEMQGAHMHTEDGYDDGDYDGSAFSADADAGDASEGGEADHLRGEEILDGFSNEEYIKS